jgi:hypothetical protein
MDQVQSKAHYRTIRLDKKISQNFRIPDRKYEWKKLADIILNKIPGIHLLN